MGHFHLWTLHILVVPTTFEDIHLVNWSWLEFFLFYTPPNYAVVMILLEQSSYQEYSKLKARVEVLQRTQRYFSLRLIYFANSFSFDFFVFLRLWLEI